MHLSQLDLTTDSAARRVVKDDAVSVEFAAHAGGLMSLEGPNRYAAGDVSGSGSGSGGERWVVSRERFDAKYVAQGGIAHGEAGTYRKPAERRAGQRDARALFHRAFE